MQFRTLAEYFAQLREVSSRTQMIKLLAELLDKASPQEAAIISYLVLGELRPPYEGTQFNLAERSLIKVVARVLGISETEAKNKMAEAGDIGDVVVQGTWHGSLHEVAVTHMHHALCKLEALSGAGSQETRLEDLVQILKYVSPLEAALVVRIISGSLRLGFSDMTVIDAISWMLVGSKAEHDLIERAYNICADIGKIAYSAKEGGKKAIEHIHMQIGIPVRPAAAERLPTAQAIIEKLGTCIVQPKFDGFRLQVHVERSQGKVHVTFFSRNLHKLEAGIFPELEQAFHTWYGASCILEGEAIAYQESTGQFLPFQETVKRRRKHKIADIAQEFPLKLILFDILCYHGESTIDLPHHKRYELLHKVADSMAHTAVSVVKEIKVSTSSELEECFYEAIEHGLEGLVIKRDDAVYQAGKRNFNWIKLKRQEIGRLEDTIDAVVLGYYVGRGKRAQFGIGAFLVGVYDKKRDRFETLAKIGTGLSDEEWKQLKKLCDARTIQHKPINVECAPLLEPYAWVSPDLVVEVEADEITKSPVHTAGKTEKTHYGFALRFPRLVKVREDKSASDATTVDEVISMYRDQRLEDSGRPAKPRK